MALISVPPLDPAVDCARCPATVRPYWREPSGEPGSDRCYYRCQACGHRWWTSRLLSYEEMAEFGRAGAA